MIFNESAQRFSKSIPSSPKRNFFPEPKPYNKTEAIKTKQNYVVVDDVRETFDPALQPGRDGYRDDLLWGSQPQTFNQLPQYACSSESYHDDKRDKRNEKTWNKFLQADAEKNAIKRGFQYRSSETCCSYHEDTGQRSCSRRHDCGGARYYKKPIRHNQNTFHQPYDNTSPYHDGVNQSNSLNVINRKYKRHPPTCERTYNVNYVMQAPEAPEDASLQWKQRTKEQSFSKPSIVINSENRLPFIVDNRKKSQRSKHNSKEISGSSSHNASSKSYYSSVYEKISVLGDNCFAFRGSLI